MSKPLIVTRHAALVEYIREIGIAAEAEVVPHASPEVIAGRDCIGPLPLRLAALAASVTEIPLDLPLHLRGVELTLDQVRQYAGPIAVYMVKKVAP